VAFFSLRYFVNGEERIGECPLVAVDADGIPSLHFSPESAYDQPQLSPSELREVELFGEGFAHTHSFHGTLP
jgi:hypothetical protein